MQVSCTLLRQKTRQPVGCLESREPVPSGRELGGEPRVGARMSDWLVSWVVFALSAALRIPAGEACHAAIHHDDGRGTALGAELGAFRVV